jgi:hypothetical protein
LFWRGNQQNKFFFAFGHCFAGCFTAGSPFLSFFFFFFFVLDTCAVVTTMVGGTMQSYVDGTGTVARFNIPSGIAFDLNGNLIIADNKNHLIRRVTLMGGAKVSRLCGRGVCITNVRRGLPAR